MSGIRTEDDRYGDGGEDDDDSGQRTVWAILSWVAVALTIILNLVLIVIVVIRKNFSTLANKGSSIVRY